MFQPLRNLRRRMYCLSLKPLNVDFYPMLSGLKLPADGDAMGNSLSESDIDATLHNVEATI